MKSFTPPVVSLRPSLTIFQPQRERERERPRVFLNENLLLMSLFVADFEYSNMATLFKKKKNKKRFQDFSSKVIPPRPSMKHRCVFFSTWWRRRMNETARMKGRL